MMKKIFAAVVVVSLCVLPGLVWAGELAEKVQETYRGTESFRADFSQKTHVELLDREVEEAGELIFAKPGRFSIHYQGKRERRYLSDGKTLWIYHPREKEVEVVDNVQDVVAKEALVFLGGLGEMSKEFRVTEGKKDGGLVLTPKSKLSPFTKIRLKIDPVTSLVSEVVLFPKSGNQSHYLFSSVRVNEPVAEGTFVFKKAGVKEIRPLATEE